MQFGLENPPEGWSIRWNTETESLSSEITRTGEKCKFHFVEFKLDLRGVLNEQTVLLTGAVGMGDCMKKYALSDLRGPLPADCSVLFRIGKEDFLLVAIASWRIFSGKILVDHDQVRVRFYGDGRPFAPGETCRLEEVFFRRGNSERELLDAYADFTAKNHAVNLNLCHWSGSGTWDYYSAKFSDRSIRENLDELEKLSSTVNLLQIDDGYSVWGDWMEILPQVLPDGLPAIVREAAGRNLKTGIWFAPFLAHCTANVVKKHPEWFLRREDGSLRYYGNGGHVILDYSQDEVVEHIRRCVRFFMDAGMVYLKLDFLLAGTAFGKSRVPMTPYERFHRALSAIREEAGKSVYLLGCSAEFGPCVGHVDGMRVGPDISPNFNSVKMSARCCMASAPFHRKWFQCDPDYLVVRGEGMDDAERTSPTKLGSLTLNEASMWADFVSLTGNAVLAGDKLSILTPDRRKLVADTLRCASENPEFRILDYWRGGADDFPGMIYSSGRLGLFNWTDAEQEFRLPDGGSRLLPARSSVVLEMPGWTGNSLPAPERPLERSVPLGEPFDNAADALPLPLGEAAEEPLEYDHETGKGILRGVYAPLRGKQILLGVPFEIGENAVSFWTTDEKNELRIPVGRRVKTLYFLHAADYPVRGEWLRYRVRNVDGTETEHPVVLGREIGNTDYRYSVPWKSDCARIAWVDPSASCRTLYLLRIPFETEREVESIVVTHPMQNGSHVLLGISTSGR